MGRPGGTSKGMGLISGVMKNVVEKVVMVAQPLLVY